MNPELPTDATYRRFIADPPPGAILINVNYTDNPFLPQVLVDEMEDLRRRDPDAVPAHLAGQLPQLAGRRDLRQRAARRREGEPHRRRAIRSGGAGQRLRRHRLGRLHQPVVRTAHCWRGAADRLHPGRAAADRALSARAAHPRLQRRHRSGCRTTRVPKAWAPGAASRSWCGADGWKVRIVPQLSVADGINATCARCFRGCGSTERRCEEGLQSLRHYRYEIDQQTGQFSRQPLHDHASHGADSLRYVSVAMQERGKLKLEIPSQARPRFPGEAAGLNGLGWMAR